MQRYRGEIVRHRRPFWFPASNYYVLTVAVVIAVFFLIWGILHDGAEASTPWIPAGLGAAIVLASAVVLREIVLRGARNRFLESQRQIDRNIRGISRRLPNRERAKLTLERNAAILHEIARKSEAAKVLGRFAEGHRDVFELCSEYLAAVERELPHVGVGSPRIAALRRGTEVAGRYHHYHMLQWAELESRSLTQRVGPGEKNAGKLDLVQAALGVVDFALESYPQDLTLLDSRRVLLELATSMRVAELVEKAERAAFKGNEKRALDLYHDALFILQRDSPLDHADSIEHVTAEISRLQERSGHSGDLP